jgi:hypothetical protein
MQQVQVDLTDIHRVHVNDKARRMDGRGVAA